MFISDSNRLEAFSDGVFSIAITLLVLEIKVPKNLYHGTELSNALLEEWPTFVAFLTSFATIGMAWIRHHHLFKLIDNVSNPLFYANLLILLIVTFLPFPMALVAEYFGTPAEQVAVGVYTGTDLILSLAFLIMWQFVSRADYNRRVEMSAIAPVGMKWVYWSGLLLRTVAFVLTFVSTYAAMAITLATSIFLAVPSKDHNRN